MYTRCRGTRRSRRQVAPWPAGDQLGRNEYQLYSIGRIFPEGVEPDDRVPGVFCPAAWRRLSPNPDLLAESRPCYDRLLPQASQSAGSAPMSRSFVS